MDPVLVRFRADGWRGVLSLRFVRYSMVSAVSVVMGQALLISFNGVLGWVGWVSNLLAVSLSAVPSYLLNRYWVWSKRGPNHLWGEVLPFWSMAVLGLAISTWLVAVADHKWGTSLAVSAANLVAFGSLWLAKFVILNRVLFRVGDLRPTDILEEEAQPASRAPRA